MGNRKHTLTFNLDFDEEFNREINEVIKAKVMESVRANCQSIIDDAVNKTIPKVVSERINEISEYRLRTVMERALAGMINTPEFRKVVDDSTRMKISEHTDIDFAIDMACANWVSRRLNAIVPADIVVAVTQALLKDGMKDGANQPDSGDCA